MAVIAKFYMRDQATPNTGTMPGTGDAFIHTNSGSGTPATGARTARDATDVAGVSNPDVESSVTAAADTTSQQLEHRRFVSAPLAAHTFANADGNWTFSWAHSESNTNHNAKHTVHIYGWRPSTGARVGTGEHGGIQGVTFGATAETAESAAVSGFSTALTIIDGDILVFEVVSGFTQGMATAYTDQFAYDGTTEADIVSCASFVTPPAALTLFVASTQTPDIPGLSVGGMTVGPAFGG